MPLTYDERERLAYITNSPLHVLFAEMEEHLDVRQEAHDQELSEKNNTIEELQTKFEVIQGEFETVSSKMKDIARLCGKTR